MSILKEPLITIITVVYNCEQTLAKTIESVINQSYKNLQYIIIDGGSTDNTVNIIKSYSDQISFWESQKDDGIYDAINKGIKMATGDVIGIINADDFYEENAAKIIAENFEEGLVIYHGSLRNIADDGKIFVNPATKNVRNLKRGMVLNHPATFVNKSVYDTLGAFSTEYKVAGDWDFILRSYLNKVKFIKIDEVLANFSLGGVSGSISLEYLDELSRVRKNNGLYKTWDKYYIYDKIRFLLLGKYLYKLYLLKQKLLSAK